MPHDGPRRIFELLRALSRESSQAQSSSSSSTTTIDWARIGPKGTKDGSAKSTPKGGGASRSLAGSFSSSSPLKESFSDTPSEGGLSDTPTDKRCSEQGNFYECYVGPFANFITSPDPDKKAEVLFPLPANGPTLGSHGTLLAEIGILQAAEVSGEGEDAADASSSSFVQLGAEAAPPAPQADPPGEPEERIHASPAPAAGAGDAWMRTFDWGATRSLLETWRLQIGSGTQAGKAALHILLFFALERFEEMNDEYEIRISINSQELSGFPLRIQGFSGTAATRTLHPRIGIGKDRDTGGFLARRMEDINHLGGRLEAPFIHGRIASNTNTDPMWYYTLGAAPPAAAAAPCAYPDAAAAPCASVSDMRRSKVREILSQLTEAVHAPKHKFPSSLLVPFAWQYTGVIDAAAVFQGVDRVRAR